MRKWKLVAVSVVALVALMASTGCVSKKVFKKNVEETDARMSGVESGVEANERRTSELAKETDTKIASVKGTAEKAVEIGNTALNRAQVAEKLARGKILWTTTLSDDRVKFSFAQSEMPPEAATVLDDLAAKVKALDKAVYLEIEGHTDNIGGEAFNQELGLKRADAVRTYLASQGIPLHAMSVISFGETKPVEDNRNSDGRSKNRRVVIRVLE